MLCHRNFTGQIVPGQLTAYGNTGKSGFRRCSFGRYPCGGIAVTPYGRAALHPGRYQHRVVRGENVPRPEAVESDLDEIESDQISH
ncbi:hypothetical protein [Anaerotruncus sp. G3(2012)]|uniref:hypothetical protein n=1 Tax=Anaerotruncus sp. G3(2012) TaxID=1235835 RepID=UPI0003B7A3A4|nr:hypothetical protein [Anaerotruncus sp. G3(2012)]